MLALAGLWVLLTVGAFLFELLACFSDGLHNFIMSIYVFILPESILPKIKAYFTYTLFDIFN